MSMIFQDASRVLGHVRCVSLTWLSISHRVLIRILKHVDSGLACCIEATISRNRRTAYSRQNRGCPRVCPSAQCSTRLFERSVVWSPRCRSHSVQCLDNHRLGARSRRYSGIHWPILGDHGDQLRPAFIGAYLLVSINFLGEPATKTLTAIAHRYVFYPLSWLMGVPKEDLLTVSRILGIKFTQNEFVAYLELSTVKSTMTTRGFNIA